MDEMTRRLAAQSLMGGSRRGMQRRAMAGLDPTAEQQAAYDAGAAEREERASSLASLTGIPQAGAAIGEAVQDPSIANVATAGIRSAAVVPTFRAMKLAAALTAGGLGALGAREVLAPSEAQAQGSPFDKRNSEIGARIQQIDAAILAAQGNKKMSRAQTEEAVRGLNAEKAVLAQERERNVREMASETSRLAQQAKAEEQAKAQAEAPLRERYPDAFKVAVAGAFPLAGALGMGIASKTLNNVGKANAQATAAMEAGDVTKYLQNRAMADKLSRWAPAKIAGGVAAAGTLPVDIQAGADFIDWKTMPRETRAYKEANAQFGDPVAYAKNALPSLMGGILAASAGAGKSIATSSSRAQAAAMKDVDGVFGSNTPDGAAKMFAGRNELIEQLRSARVTAERSAQTGDLVHESALSVLKDQAGKLPKKDQAEARQLLADALRDMRNQRALPASQSQSQPALGGASGGQAATSGGAPAVAPNVTTPAPATQAGNFTNADEIWAKQYSPHARQILVDHLTKGGNIVKGARAKDGGMSVENLDASIKAAHGSKGAGKPQTTRHLDMLRDELSRQGIDVAKLTPKQLRDVFKSLDPKVFGVAGGAALSAEAMRQMLAERLMQEQ